MSAPCWKSILLPRIIDRPLRSGFGPLEAQNAPPTQVDDAMKATDFIDNDSLRDDIPEFQAGDELKVHVRVVEGGKERIQVFQGDVIARQGGGLQETYSSIVKWLSA